MFNEGQLGPQQGFAMSNEEIAARLGVTLGAVKQTIARAMRKIERNGEISEFNTVVRLTRLQKANVPFIRCGSIECRPEKWVFYAQR